MDMARGSKIYTSSMVPMPSFQRIGSSRIYDEDDDCYGPPTTEEHVMSSDIPAMISAKYQFNMFTAFLVDSIEPRVPVKELLDGEDAENDISQIVGRVNDAADLPDGRVGTFHVTKEDKRQEGIHFLDHVSCVSFRIQNTN